MSKANARKRGRRAGGNKLTRVPPVRRVPSRPRKKAHAGNQPRPSSASKTHAVDDLARPVKLYICKDGTLTFDPIWGPQPAGLTNDWRDVAIDLILEGKTEDAAGVLVENRDEPMLPEPERENYSLPVFSVDTQEQAKAIQVRFCRLMYEAHPFMDKGTPWYTLTRFSGEYEDLARVTAEFRDFYRRLCRSS